MIEVQRKMSDGRSVKVISWPWCLKLEFYIPAWPTWTGGCESRKALGGRRQAAEGGSDVVQLQRTLDTEDFVNKAD